MKIKKSNNLGQSTLYMISYITLIVLVLAIWSVVLYGVFVSGPRSLASAVQCGKDLQCAESVMKENSNSFYYLAEGDYTSPSGTVYQYSYNITGERIVGITYRYFIGNFLLKKVISVTPSQPDIISQAAPKNPITTKVVAQGEKYTCGHPGDSLQSIIGSLVPKIVENVESGKQGSHILDGLACTDLS